MRRWEVEDGARDEEGVGLERQLVGISARWRERVREGEGLGLGERVREPWRLDEDVERLVWYEDEGDDDEDDEDEEEEEEVGDEGDGDEEEDEEGEEEFTEEEAY